MEEADNSILPIIRSSCTIVSWVCSSCLFIESNVGPDSTTQDVKRPTGPVNFKFLFKEASRVKISGEVNAGTSAIIFFFLTK